MRFVGIGEEVSVEGAIVQSAQALDFAGKFASEGRDTEKLLQVAEAWTKVADFIVALSEHEAKLAEKTEKKETPFGFQSSEKDDTTPAQQEDENTIIVEEDEDVRS